MLKDSNTFATQGCTQQASIRSLIDPVLLSDDITADTIKKFL